MQRIIVKRISVNNIFLLCFLCTSCPYATMWKWVKFNDYIFDYKTIYSLWLYILELYAQKYWINEIDNGRVNILSIRKTARISFFFKIFVCVKIWKGLILGSFQALKLKLASKETATSSIPQDDDKQAGIYFAIHKQINNVKESIQLSVDEPITFDRCFYR